jgi:hypothetical protein
MSKNFNNPSKLVQRVEVFWTSLIKLLRYCTDNVKDHKLNEKIRILAVITALFLPRKMNVFLNAILALL